MGLSRAEDFVTATAYPLSLLDALAKGVITLALSFLSLLLCDALDIGVALTPAFRFRVIIKDSVTGHPGLGPDFWWFRRRSLAGGQLALSHPDRLARWGKPSPGFTGVVGPVADVTGAVPFSGEIHGDDHRVIDAVMVDEMVQIGVGNDDIRWVNDAAEPLASALEMVAYQRRMEVQTGLWYGIRR